MGTTNFPNGLTNMASTKPTGQLIIPDPTSVHMFFDDFNSYTAGDWTVTTTEAGAGSATEVIQDESGGVLKLTNAANDNDCDYLQLVKETFVLVAGKKAWMKARLKVSDATESDFIIGITDRDTTPLGASDGIFFQKDDGDTNLDFHVAKTGTTTSATAIATIADDTYVNVGVYYDGGSVISYYIDDVKIGAVAATNLPAMELCVTMGIRNGAAAVKSMSIDYVFVCKER